METSAESRVAIIGAGPAGVGAAVQLGRYGVAATVFEKGAVGGLVRNARRLDNFAGFPAGVAGPALAALLGEQLAAAGAALRREEVVSLTCRAGGFAVTAAAGAYEFAAAIVASGTRARPWPEAKVGAAARGKIFTEITALRGARGKRFAVIGAGDAAFDYALTLAEYNSVTIVNRGSARRCLPVLWEEANAAAAIAYRAETRVITVEAVGDGLSLACETAAGPTTLAMDFLVLAIGREPAADFLMGGADAFRAATAEGYFFMIGDVANGRGRQAAIAYGEGVKAAMAVAERLRT